MRLSLLPINQPALVDHVDWSALSPAEAQRLKEFGLREGAGIEALHRGGLLGGGPIACRIGRMTVAMRRHHAQVIEVRPASEAA